MTNVYIVHGDAESQFHHWGTYKSSKEALNAAVDIARNLYYSESNDPIVGVSKVRRNIMHPLYVVAILDEQEYKVFKGLDIENDHDTIMDSLYDIADEM